MGISRQRQILTCGVKPDPRNLLAWWPATATDGNLIARYPRAPHATQQVKGSGFAGVGPGTITGLLTTDDLTSSGPNTPTCTVDGTVTFGADCWDIFWHRDGVLIDYFPGINIGGSFEIGAKGVGNVLYLTDTTITERTDGTGTNYANEVGFTVGDGATTYLDQGLTTVIGAGWRIPVIYGSPSQCAGYLVPGVNRVKINNNFIISSPWSAALGFKSNVAERVYDDVTFSARIESTGANARGFWTVSTQVTDGKKYAVTVKVTDCVGKFHVLAATAGTGGTPTSIVRYDYPTVAATDFTPGMTFVASGTGSVSIRIGINPDGGAVTNPAAATFSEWDVHEIPAAQTLPSERTYPRLPVLIGNDLGHTVVNNTINMAMGADRDVNKNSNILIFGDSFGNDATDWPQVFTKYPDRVYYNNSVSGSSIQQAIDTFASQAELTVYKDHLGTVYPEMPSYVERPGSIVLARGINDLILGKNLEQMQQVIISFVDLCSNMEHVVMFDIPPWKANASWTQPREDIRTAYNAWLPDYCATDSRLSLFKISEVLADTDPLYLKAAYDSGDGIHPNAAGGTAIALAITPILALGGIDVGYPGPLGIDAPFDGTVFPIGNFQAPLGRDFQAIPEFTDNASVDLETLAPTAKIRIGDNGMAVYSADLDAAGIARADRVVGVTSAWFEIMFEDGSAYTFEDGSLFELHGN